MDKHVWNGKIFRNLPMSKIFKSHFYPQLLWGVGLTTTLREELLTFVQITQVRNDTWKRVHCTNCSQSHPLSQWNSFCLSVPTTGTQPTEAEFNPIVRNPCEEPEWSPESHLGGSNHYQLKESKCLLPKLFIKQTACRDAASNTLGPLASEQAEASHKH